MIEPDMHHDHHALFEYGFIEWYHILNDRVLLDESPAGQGVVEICPY